MDKNLRYIATNNAYRAMLGYTEEELSDRSPLDFVAEEDRKTAQDQLATLLSGDNRHYKATRRWIRRDGSLMWADLYTSIIRGKNSQSPIFLGTVIDITDRIRAQDSSRIAEAELERVARLTTVAEIAGSIAHEIRQPLGAIVMNGIAGLRFLRRADPDRDGVKTILQQIVADGHRMQEIVEGILRMFRHDRMKRDDLIDVNEIIKELVLLVQDDLRSNGVTVLTELAAALPRIQANRTQLQQVLINMIRNALEAMRHVPIGERNLTVRTEIGADDDLLISVVDSGPGIPPENAKLVFDKFYTTKPAGMGMGLAICRSIVEAHEGRVWIEPAVPRGVVFRVSLPVHMTAT
jgi:PAS domain S-box-containing protein